MSPFKVIRCRYFTEDGKGVYPYCSAGSHCTFLHPKDKGWPGGDPVPEVDKRDKDNRAAERLLHRAPKCLDRAFSFSAGRTPSDRASSSTVDLNSQNFVSRKGSSTSIITVVNTFSYLSPSDIAKLQNKLTQDKDQLDKMVTKLASFRELSESLMKVSAASAAAVAPTLESILKTRNELRAKIEDDMGQLSDLWTAVLNDFLRAICRQFDSELEAGTDYLRQEARLLLKSFPKHTGSARLADTTAPTTSLFSRTHSRSPTSGGNDEYSMCLTAGNAIPGRSVTTKEVSTRDLKSDDEDIFLAVNPPVGISDNGWSRKRRRVSSDNQGHDGHPLNETSQTELQGLVAKMQLQLEDQNNKIILLTKQNDQLSHIVERHSSALPAVTHGPNAHAAPAGTVSEAERPQIRRTLRDDVLALINPAFEEQKKVNDHWAAQFSLITEKLEEMGIMEARSGVDDVTMASTPQPNCSIPSSDSASK